MKIIDGLKKEKVSDLKKKKVKKEIIKKNKKEDKNLKNEIVSNNQTDNEDNLKNEIVSKDEKKVEDNTKEKNTQEKDNNLKKNINNVKIKNPKKEFDAKKIETLYYTIDKPGSFSGVHSFLKNLKSKVDREELKKWLEKQESYTLHKPKLKKISTSKTIVNGINDTWQIDLVDMRSFKDENDGFQYILTSIDAFSRVANAIPLKNKTGQVTFEGIKKLMKQKQPLKIHCDEGNEFYNKFVLGYLKENNIRIYSTKSKYKASIVERFNRTLKEKMWRYFTFSNSYRYIDILKDFVKSYNNSYHRTLKMKPIEVNKKNFNKVFLNIYGFNNDTISKEEILYKPKFYINDYVRISLDKNIFEKGYTPNWSKQVYYIDKVIFRDKPTFSLKDLNNNPVEKYYYEQQLQKVDINSIGVFDIEKIIDTRINKKKEKEYLVKWKNYPSSYNSWVHQSDLE